jgi:hypothetical protein
VIVLLAALAVVGIGAGRLAAWARRRRSATRRDVRDQASPARAKDVDLRLTGFPCGLGDVVLLAQGDEAWLAGALLFRERASHRDEAGDLERTVAVLFVAPDRGADHAVYARPIPEPSLDWMFPVAPEALTLGPEPPSAIEHEGERFERVRRIPLSMTRAGMGAPDLGSDAVVGEYAGGAGTRLLVVCAAATRVWRGHRLEPGMYDILPRA